MTSDLAAETMKVGDIRPGGVMTGQAEAMQADIDWLAARAGQFVDVTCPACESADAADLYEKYGLNHRRCGSCGTQYVSPRATAEMLGEFYARSENYAYWAKHIFPKSAEARREKIFRPRAEIVGQIAADLGLTGGVLVEVGAAHGLFCQEVDRLGVFDKIVGIEPTPDLAAQCRELGIETIEASYETTKLDLNCDFVANFEVIEHLFDPGAFLAWCHDLLAPGGQILLTCPNIAGFETMVLGAASDTVDHEHLNLFSPVSLTALAERSGFVDIRINTPGKLDLEIVQNAIQAGRVDLDDLDPVVRHFVSRPDSDIGDRFQKLLSDAGLSSNMMLLARRPA